MLKYFFVHLMYLNYLSKFIQYFHFNLSYKMLIVVLMFLVCLVNINGEQLQVYVETKGVRVLGC